MGGFCLGKKNALFFTWARIVLYLIQNELQSSSQVGGFVVRNSSIVSSALAGSSWKFDISPGWEAGGGREPGHLVASSPFRIHGSLMLGLTYIEVHRVDNRSKADLGLLAFEREVNGTPVGAQVQEAMVSCAPQQWPAYRSM